MAEAFAGSAPTWGTVAIGVFVAVVAFLQWKTARDKLAVDLFDRRFAAYNKFLEIAAERSNPTHTDNKIDPLERDSRISLHTLRFLFDDHVLDRAEDVNRTIAKIVSLKVNKRSPLSAAYASALTEYKVAIIELQLTIAPYMMLGRISVSKPSPNAPWFTRGRLVTAHLRQTVGKLEEEAALEEAGREAARAREKPTA